ncbi:MAG: SDR family oxidoreductase [Candidatus Omnitrophota bacterium]
MARFVVTGGAGFIGSHLVEHLLSEGHEVAVVDNFSTGLRENLKPFAERIRLFECDLRHLDDVRRAMEGAEYVLHQAALPSVPRSVENPVESHESNATGTLNTLWAAKEAGVKRLLYAASSSAYGDAETLRKDENLPTRPLSPYGVAKLAGENYCQSFYKTYGFETVCLRYFNVFGPRQNPRSAYTGVMAIFIPLMLQGKQPTIFGDGSITRDFTFIRNVIHANRLALTAEKAPGEVINAACGESHSLLEIVDTINRLLGTNIQPQFAPPRLGDIQHSCASIDKAKILLGYEPTVSFEDGMAETIEWYRRESNL